MALIGAIELAELGADLVGAEAAADWFMGEAETMVEPLIFQPEPVASTIGKYGGYAGLPLIVGGMAVNAPSTPKKQIRNVDDISEEFKTPAKKKNYDGDTVIEPDISGRKRKEPDPPKQVPDAEALGELTHRIQKNQKDILGDLGMTSRKKSMDFKGYKKVSQYQFDYGSSVSDSRGVFVGCGPNLPTMVNQLWEAVVAALFEKAGIEYHYGEVIKGSFFIEYQFYPSPANIASTSAKVTATSTNSSFQNLALALKNKILSDVVSSDQPIFTQFGLFFVNATADVLLARLNAESISIGFSQVNNMFIQNSTLGGVTGDVTRDAHAVDNNPLYGRVYTASGNHMRFKHQVSTQDEPIVYNTIPFYTEKASGYFINNSNVGDQFIAKRSKGFTLQSGKICKISTVMTGKHLLNTWTGHLRDYIDTGTAPILDAKVPLGENKLVVLERTIHHIATEQPVKVQWELNTSSWVSFKIVDSHRNFTNYQEIFTTPVT